MASYFDSFNIIQYSNNFCRSIISRAAITKENIKNSSLFYNYDLKEGDRAELVSYLYYGAPESDWLIYLANDVIDPYYDVTMTEDQLTKFVISKYGSLAKANRLIKHYRVNWKTDVSQKTLAGYEALSSQQKKYWQPVINDSGITTQYVRRQLDSVVVTNRIVSLSQPDAALDNLVVGEELIQTTNNTTSARGEVIYTSPNKVFVKNVYGTFQTNKSTSGTTSEISFTPIEVQIVQYGIPDEEVVYWDPVSYFDYEFEINEKKKNIRLIDKDYLELAEKNLKDALK